MIKVTINSIIGKYADNNAEIYLDVDSIFEAKCIIMEELNKIKQEYNEINTVVIFGKNFIDFGIIDINRFIFEEINDNCKI